MIAVPTFVLGAAVKAATGWPWVGLNLALLLLLALPLAIALRLRTRFPERAEAAFRARPWTARLLGAADVLLVLVVGSAARGHRVLSVVGLLLLGLLLLLLLGGWAGLALSFGRGMSAERDGGPGAGAYALGWLVASGMPAFPVLGPLVFLWFAAGAIGSAILAACRSKDPPTG